MSEYLKSYQMADLSVYNKLKEFAEKNRKNQTDAESILWGYLKSRQLGVVFRRQHIIGKFIADFSCVVLKLIIEIDGAYHQLPEQQVSDEERSQWLNSQGFTVIRFTNEEILSDIDNVIIKIKGIIWKLKNK
ncbi:MAG: endonuclease domain-containing protein [Prevotella sp.]